MFRQYICRCVALSPVLESTIGPAPAHFIPSDFNCFPFTFVPFKTELFSRALMFVHNNFGGAVPAMDLTEEDKNFIALVNKELKTYIDDLEKMR